jgi:hypothetical protein
LFLRRTPRQARPQADLFAAAKAVSDRRTDGIEKLADLRGRLHNDQGRKAKNEHTKDEALGRAPDAFLS